MAALNVKEPAGKTVRTTARRMARALLKSLRAAQTGGSVHGARRQIKGLRALLRFIRKAIGDKSFRKADRVLDTIADILSGRRRTEALGEAIAKLELHQGLKIALPPDPARQPGEAAGTMDDAVRLAMDFAQQTRGWQLPRNAISPYLAGLKRSYGMAKRKLAKGLKEGDFPTLHQARRHVIHHLHHVGLLHKIRPATFRTWVADIQALREALGDLNDLVELRSAIGTSEGAALAAIEMRQAALLSDVTSLGKPLFSERPKDLANRIGAMWKRARR